jgi:DNA-binding transcriptional MerR regulator/methylmalonyl-CoA mutase cobalamin-binding subunit
VVAPVRSEGGQRLYSDSDVERLALLRTLTDGGYAIGQLARLSGEELNRLVQQEPRPEPIPGALEPIGPETAALRAALLGAIDRFDAAGLRQGLESAAVGLGIPRFLNEVLAPLLTEIGLRWRDGRMSIAHEHLATAVVRQVLGWVRETVETPGPGPMLVVATPALQLHEGGALLAAATAAAEGWRVTYLGADLPAGEIADAARRASALAVALSLLHPSDDPGVGADLQTLRQALPAALPILVGGSAAGAYAAAIQAVNGRVVSDLPTLRQTLRALAAAAPSRP